MLRLRSVESVKRFPFLRSARPSAAALVSALSVALGGCLGPEVDPATDVESGTTRALIQIDSVSDGDAPEATALAGFAEIPVTTDPEAFLDLVGWRLDVPPIAHCAPVRGDATPPVPDSAVERVEFLDAGDVMIRAGSARTTLAPRALPSVSDLISGVVYTTRDASTDPLPLGADYEVQTTGGVLPPLAVSGRAPSAISGLNLAGTPFGEVEAVHGGVVLDLSWDPGAAGDRLVVELAREDGSATACAFPDEAGVGSVPAAVVPTAGGGWVSVHRVRVVPIETPEIDRGELRFDLEREIAVTYVR
jgi:hypothetical protein